MNVEKRRKLYQNAGREVAYLSVFVALTIAAQLCLAVLPGVELVTVLFVGYAFAAGARRGMLAATAFSLVRQLVFLVFPTVLLLYLLYFNLLAALFGALGRRVKNPVKALWWLTVLACVCTTCFTLLDNVITPLWYGYSRRAAKAYFWASLPFMLPQIACTAATVSTLFLPFQKVFAYAHRQRR